MINRQRIKEIARSNGVNTQNYCINCLEAQCSRINVSDEEVENRIRAIFVYKMCVEDNRNDNFKDCSCIMDEKIIAFRSLFPFRYKRCLDDPNIVRNSRSFYY